MQRKNSSLFVLIFCLAAGSAALAQGPGQIGGPGHDGFGRPPMEKTFHDGQFGRWWENPKIAQAINLTDDQKKKMDDIFQQHRLSLVDLHATLEKQEIEMKPMIEADQPDEGQVLAQIDKIAQARAELEKANARMLFEIRRTLSAEQWQKLKALHSDRHMNGGPGGGPAAPGAWHRRQPGPPADGAAPQGPAPQGDAQDVPPPAPGDGAPGSPVAPQF
jgi:Spy/CpxP family protein refolding chaperone